MTWLVDDSGQRADSGSMHTRGAAQTRVQALRKPAVERRRHAVDTAQRPEQTPQSQQQRRLFSRS